MLRSVYFNVDSQENGFTIEETIVNYYKRVYPPDCYILRKKVFDGA